MGRQRKDQERIPIVLAAGAWDAAGLPAGAPRGRPRSLGEAAPANTTVCRLAPCPARARSHFRKLRLNLVADVDVTLLGQLHVFQHSARDTGGLRASLAGFLQPGDDLALKKEAPFAASDRGLGFLQALCQEVRIHHTTSR